MPFSNNTYHLPPNSIEQDTNVLNAADLNEPREDMAEGITTASRLWGGMNAQTRDQARQMLGIQESAGVMEVTSPTFLTVDDLNKTIHYIGTSASNVVLPPTSALAVSEDNHEQFIKVRNLTTQRFSVFAATGDVIINPDRNDNEIFLSNLGQSQTFLWNPSTNEWLQDKPFRSPSFADDDSLWRRSAGDITLPVMGAQIGFITIDDAGHRAAYKIALDDLKHFMQAYQEVAFNPSDLRTGHLWESPAGVRVSDYRLVFRDKTTGQQFTDSRDCLPGSNGWTVLMTKIRGTNNDSIRFNMDQNVQCLNSFGSSVIITGTAYDAVLQYLPDYGA